MKKKCLIMIFFVTYLSVNCQIKNEDEVFFKNSTNEVKIYNNDLIDKKATFRGGFSELFEFYKNNSRFKVKNFEIPSKSVYFNLYINELGEVYDYKVIKSSGKIYNKELERLIGLMPNWNPAFHEEKPIRVIIFDYITFER